MTGVATYLARSRGLGFDLSVLEDMGLLLESTLRLNSQFRRHVCDVLSRSQMWLGSGIVVVLVVANLRKLTKE